MKFRKNIAGFILLAFAVSFALPLRAMNLARAETRTDLAVSTYGVSGQGVIVAILDRGIDWKNNDFRNDDGTTRIKYIFDLTDNSGANAPGNPYGVGTIYTEAQINAALNGGTQLATRDAVGHGTTTSAIAAGNGRNSTKRKYRGIAPNATIIMVKFTTEGAPAHDTQAAEAPFYNPDLLQPAISFVRAKATELSMPAVLLANFGSINGPTDGTSAFSRTIDANFGSGKPGFVFVNGTGDDGGMPNHAGGVIAQGETNSIQIQKVNAGNLRMDLWYGGSDRFTVSLQTPNGNFGPYSPPNNGTSSTVSNSTFACYHQGVGQVFYGATNQKREILLDIAGPAGTYTVQLTGTTITGNGRFDATLNPSNIAGAANNNRFLNNVVAGSIWDGATAQNNIAPNSYNIRNTWVDIDGFNRATQNQGAINDLWRGSSTGPTFDGRLGVDFSAPGDSVFTTYNPTSYFATFRFNLIQDGGGFYGRASAVSAAAPQVTGIIALMLEKNPRLDQIQIRAMLRNSARADAFTGAVPNPNWGYGKVDALNAVRLAAQSVRTPFDFDGDGKSDLSVFRSSNMNWYINRSSNNQLSGAQFGLSSDKLAPADFDGDGKTDIAVRREAEGNFYILNSSDNSVRVENFGLAGDVLSVGDWDSDGKADLAVYRAGAQSFFYYRGSLNNPSGSVTSIAWGISGDFPQRGDFDGDSKADAAVFRPSNNVWYILQSSNNSVRYDYWGLGTDKFVPADYDGDAKIDLAVFRNGVWYIKQSANNQPRYEYYGLSTDTLVPADYDGDGKIDVAIFRNGQWYLNQSTSGLTVANFGLNGDAPIPAAFINP
ncbi:MAG: S8 family serine peptidase [Pyrinomonadaceae bacterium]